MHFQDLQQSIWNTILSCRALDLIHRGLWPYAAFGADPIFVSWLEYLEHPALLLGLGTPRRPDFCWTWFTKCPLFCVSPLPVSVVHTVITRPTTGKVRTLCIKLGRPLRGSQGLPMDRAFTSTMLSSSCTLHTVLLQQHFGLCTEACMCYEPSVLDGRSSDLAGRLDDLSSQWRTKEWSLSNHVSREH